MAAEAQHASPRERTDLPSIDRGKPTINSLTGAAEDIACAAERLESLFNGLVLELDSATSAYLDESARPRFYAAWMLFVTGVEKLTELHGDIAALTDAIYLRTREFAA